MASLDVFSQQNSALPFSINPHIFIQDGWMADIAQSSGYILLRGKFTHSHPYTRYFDLVLPVYRYMVLR